ncbi:MAG: hypothetical protein ACR2MO_17485 [Acidimicrobiales bacterium]
MTDHQAEDGTDQAEDEGQEAGPADDAAADAAAAAAPGDEAEAAAGAGAGDPEDDGGEDGDGEGDETADGKDRLQALEEDIEEVRRRVGDPLDQGEDTFIEEGDADEDQPVDDTIAPPG